ASLRCPRGKEINKEIRNCSECNKIIPAAPGQIKDEMVSLLVMEKELPKDEFSLLAVREDKSGLKKSLSSVFQLAKKRGGKGKKKFRVEEKVVSKYCGKHENSTSKLRESWENFGEKLKVAKKRWEELKEILEKARKEQVNPEDKGDKKKKELKSAEEKTKKCADCQKNCSQHEDLKVQHEKGNCCDKKKVEKAELKEKIEQLQSTKPNSKKLEKLREELRKLNQ
ncbi:3651_t:CDS:2, partial [Ambispora leptoticha]